MYAHVSARTDLASRGPRRRDGDVQSGADGSEDHAGGGMFLDVGFLLGIVLAGSVDKPALLTS